ncbi:MAG: CDP-alcohol phosphatidyltransferase family protein [Pseudomonadales bacterium]
MLARSCCCLLIADAVAGAWLTWANALTALRLLLALPCAWLVTVQRWDWAALLLTVAILTDLLDGPLARRLGQTSALGGLADHATDATFVALLLAALASLGYLPWLLPVLVAAAFLQYTFDSRAHTGRALRASWLGKVNGIGYFVLAGCVVYRNGLGLGWPGDAWLDGAGWLLVLSSLASMIDRLRLGRAAE